MDNNKTVENGNVKIVEPNKGRHIAVAGDINTIVASKEDTGTAVYCDKEYNSWRRSWGYSLQELIVSLRTAIVSDEWKLDKQQTSHQDTLDSLRLALCNYEFPNNV